MLINLETLESGESIKPLNLSSSSISTFAKCAKLFWFEKLSGLEGRSFTSEAIERGSMFHAGIAAALKQSDPKRNLTVATEAVMALYESGTGAINEVDEALEMLRYYLDDLGINTRNFAHTLNGVPLVEWEFDVNFGDFNLRGSVDAVIKDTSGKIFLVDWKTRRTFYTDDVVEIDKQLYIYAKILQMSGVELDGAVQIQLNAPPEAPKFKVDCDINLASSLNERSAKTTRELFDKTVAHMNPVERMDAFMKLGSKIVEGTHFKQISPIHLSDVDTVFNTVLQWGHRIAQTKEFLPIMDAFGCKSCVWRMECRASLKGQ